MDIPKPDNFNEVYLYEGENPDWRRAQCALSRFSILRLGGIVFCGRHAAGLNVDRGSSCIRPWKPC